jgi:hypothetical protein
MPYVIVSTQFQLAAGPTIVGDRFSDKELMARLDAVYKEELCKK